MKAATALLRGLGLAGVLLALCAAGAPGPPRATPDAAAAMVDVKHVSWPMERTAPSRITALGQSRDGYLWVGSVEGLFRFDGVTFEKIRPAAPRAGPYVVSALYGARSGRLWVGLGRSGGLAYYEGGQLRDARMPKPSREVTGIAETPDGAIWVARGGRFVDTLARFRDGRWEDIGEGWNFPSQRVWQILTARNGVLWVVLNDTIVRLPPGARRFEATGASVGWRASIAEDAAGRIWVSDGGDPVPLAAARRAVSDTEEHAGPAVNAKIVFDRKGRLWGTTLTRGLFRIDAPAAPGQHPSQPPGTRRTFTEDDGLTSNQARTIFLDREGNLWVGTELGLDMLRPAALAIEPGIPANSPESYHIAVTADGTVYVSDADTLYRIAPRGAPVALFTTRSYPGALCAARDGGVWLSLRDEVIRVDGARVEHIAKPAVATYYGCAQDAAGRLWLPAVDRGLLWHDAAGWHQWPGIGPDVGVPGDAVVAPDGRAAILFRRPPPPLVAAPFLALGKDNLGVGVPESLLPTRDMLLASGTQGLSAVTADGLRTLPAARYPWLGSVNGLVETRSGHVWTIGDAGIVRMEADALRAALARPGRPLAHRVFDFNDGLNSFVQKAAGLQVVEGGDGRLWFLTRRNVLVMDPARIDRNALAPSLAIRAVVAGGRRYRDPQALGLPAGTTALTVDFTATSLTVPDRVRFRYRLEGVDAGWVTPPPGRRSASYVELGPGEYRFHVIASNNDGVWNREGAVLRFTIPPTLVQTWPFRIFLALCIALALWLLYRLRLRSVKGQIRGRLEARSAERESIARDLHDTLLQGVQGLILRFHAIADQLPAQDPARASIDQTLDRAEELLAEGRDRVGDLRRSACRKLEGVLAELARSQPFSADVEVVFTTTGRSRPVRAPTVDEVAQIVGEALFNAARHARATRVEIALEYTRRCLRVSVGDNGVGIAEQALVPAAGSRHYGIIGMRERAGRIGGLLRIAGTPGAGTVVELRVPGAVAYPVRERDAGGDPWWRRVLRRAREDSL